MNPRRVSTRQCALVASTLRVNEFLLTLKCCHWRCVNYFELEIAVLENSIPFYLGKENAVSIIHFAKTTNTFWQVLLQEQQQHTLNKPAYLVPMRDL